MFFHPIRTAKGKGSKGDDTKNPIPKTEKKLVNPH